MTRGTTDAVVFDSEPPGAEMRSIEKHACGGPCPARDSRETAGAPYAGEDVKTPPIPGPACVTPCTLNVERNKELIVTFSKPGYEPQTMVLETRVGTGAAMSAGNLVVGGVAGLVIDAGTGAGMDHHPNPMKAVLKPLPAAAPARRR